MKRLARIAIVALPLITLAASPAYAEVKTRDKTQVKFEGMLGRMFSLFGGKGAKEGIEGKTAVKGNRKATLTETGGTIVDLTEEKVYDIDAKKKQYTVTTFEELRRRMREARERAIPLRTRNTVIGATPVFEFESGSVEVPPGSRLYVFSDGIYEIEAKDGQQWDLANVLPLIVEPPVAGMTEPERLLQAIRGHARNPDFDDDFTVLVATFL